QIDIAPPAPTFDAQLGKATNLVLALTCWITGYVLGIMRRHESFGTALIGWFWIALGGALGTYLFAYYSTPLLSVALAWAMIAILLPLAIYIHLWYPVRPQRQPHDRYGAAGCSGVVLHCMGCSSQR
ncbi:MAG TPA: hypothetical protein PKC19_07565, partial [Roseiflexaceae bacterium]|nr:hypothetical protein [Roseiflexaceae bacterium]